MGKYNWWQPNHQPDDDFPWRWTRTCHSVLWFFPICTDSSSPRCLTVRMMKSPILDDSVSKFVINFNTFFNNLWGPRPPSLWLNSPFSRILGASRKRFWTRLHHGQHEGHPEAWYREWSYHHWAIECFIVSNYTYIQWLKWYTTYS